MQQAVGGTARRSTGSLGDLGDHYISRMSIARAKLLRRIHRLVGLPVLTSYFNCSPFLPLSGGSTDTGPGRRSRFSGCAAS